MTQANGGGGRQLQRALGYLSGYRREASGALVALLIVAAANLATPQLIRFAIDVGFAQALPSALAEAVLGLVTVAVVRRVFTFMQGYLAERASQGVAYELRDALFAQIERLSFSYYDRAQTGQLMTRVTNDVEQVHGFVGTGVIQLAASFIMLLGMDRYNRPNSQLLERNLMTVRALSNNFPLVFFFANLGTLVVIGFGGALVMGGTLTIGELIAFNAYLAFLLQPILTIGFLASAISRASASAVRIFDVIDAPTDIQDRPGACVLPPVVGEVVYERVDFRYPGADTDVLCEISFSARPGQTVAILGTTGSGKSTVVNLLPRFYDVTGGSVRIDGRDVRDVTLASLRGQIGIVLQEALLFSGSVRANIAYGKPDADQAQIEAAARAAQAHGFISALPQGYDTIVGERGIGLSGGQRQRLAIARTLLVDPRLLILDDSTSAVDADTEAAIQQALDGLIRARHRTVFVIAQRISTVRAADLILVLDHGGAVAQGRHEDLLRESELYRQILDSQIRDDTGFLTSAVADGLAVVGAGEASA